jgi:hypothetical protein
MKQVIFEQDPYNPVYKDELTKVLQDVENRIKDLVEKHNVIITYNTEKYPNELACAIISTTYKL